MQVFRIRSSLNRLTCLCHITLVPPRYRGQSHHPTDVVLDAWGCEKELAKGAAICLLIGHTDAGQLQKPEHRVKYVTLCSLPRIRNHTTLL